MGPPYQNAAGARRTLSLARGGQAVINGALITAEEACTIEVSVGAYVLANRQLRQARSSLRNPGEELYFSLLEVEASATRFEEERMRLFQLLSETASSDIADAHRADCTLCAVALMAGDAIKATDIAARLASIGMEDSRPGARRVSRREADGEPQSRNPQRDFEW